MLRLFSIRGGSMIICNFFRGLFAALLVMAFWSTCAVLILSLSLAVLAFAAWDLTVKWVRKIFNLQHPV